jgi:hypothetical protein
MAELAGYPLDRAHASSIIDAGYHKASELLAFLGMADLTVDDVVVRAWLMRRVSAGTRLFSERAVHER